MPYKHAWYIKGQIVYAKVWGIQTLEELERSNSDMVQLLENSAGRKVHIIMNDEKLVRVRISFVQMQKVLSYTRHPKLGQFVMVGDKDKSLKLAAEDMLINLLVRITRVNYVRLPTFEEAVKFIREIDDSIDWDAVDPAFESKFAKG